MKKMKIGIITFLTALLVLVVALSGTLVYAWLSSVPRVYTSDQDSGRIARVGMRINLLFERLDSESFISGSAITFADGTETTFDPSADWGSAQNPYIISMPRHMINLYALQQSGYFYDRYIKKNYTGEDPDTGSYIADSAIKPYFLVCNTAGQATCINGNVNNKNIEINPVGNEEYPFIGCVGGAQAGGTATAPNGKTSISSIIANFDVVVDKDTPDVGLFGKIGYLGDVNSTSNVNGLVVFNGSVSGINDLLLYDIQITSKPESLLDKVADHLWARIIAEKSESEPYYDEDHHIGILAGHIEYASISNISVYYSSDEKTAIDVANIGANFLSDSGFIGLVYHLNPVIKGNSIGSETGETIAGNAAGIGEEWGGSIDMKTMFTRLRAIGETSQYTSVTENYPRTVTITIDETKPEEERRVVTESDYTNYTTVAQSGNTTYDVDYFHDSSHPENGSYVISDYNTSDYALYHGKSTTFFGTKKVITITKKGIEEGFTIKNGDYYLNASYATSASVTRDTDDESATVWQLDDQGHLFAYLDTNPNSTVGDGSDDVKKHYLNSTNNGVLALSTNASTEWTKTENGETHEGTLSYTYSDSYGGRTWYLHYNNGWGVYPFADTFTIYNGTNYLGREDSTTNLVGSTGNHAEWRLESGRLVTFINSALWYLNVSNTGALSIGTNAETGDWEENDGVLSCSTSNGFTWYLRWTGSAWEAVSSTTSYLIHSGNDFLGVINNDLSLVTQGDAVRWIVDGNKLYTVVNGVKRYLKGTVDGSGDLSLDNQENGNVWSYTINGGTMSYTGGGKTWYLYAVGGEWRVYPAASVTTISQNGAYLGVSDATTVGTSTAAWTVGGGNITTFYNGATLYLVSNGTNVTLANSASTVWTVNGDSTITNDAGWYLVYDNGWKCYPSLSYITITDGTNYMVRDGSSIGNTTTSADATRWFDDGSKLFTVDGTNTYYLRGNGTVLSVDTQANATDFTYDSENKRFTYGSTYYVIYNGNWVGSTNYATASTIKANTGNYFLNATTTGISTGTNAGSATQWYYNSTSGKIYTIISGDTYYLRAILDTNNTYSSTNLTVTDNFNNATSFSFASNNLTCTLNSTTYTLSLGSNNLFKLVAFGSDSSKTYYTIQSQNSAGNYLGLNGSSFQNATSINNAVLWEFSSSNTNTRMNVSTLISGNARYLSVANNNLSISNSGVNLYYYSYNSYYYISSNTGWGYYLQYNNNGWGASTYTRRPNNGRITRETVTYSKTSLTFSSKVYQTEEQLESVSAVNTITNHNALTNVTFTTLNTGFTQTISDPIASNNTHLFSVADYRVYTKTVTSEAAGRDTYIPLATSTDSPYNVDQKNTGYIIGGSHATYQTTDGDVRFSSHYAFNGQPQYRYNNRGYTINDVYFMQNAVNGNAYSGNNLEVLTITYKNPGQIRRISDSYNLSNPDTNVYNGTTYNETGTGTVTISGIRTITKESVNALGLTKYDNARQQLDEMFLGTNHADNATYSSSIYGMHFMDAAISIDNTIVAPKVIVNGVTYYNYEMPEDSIDFRLKTKGYINFFAGTFYYNGSTLKNNSFFSLNQIIRDGNDIKEIRHIKNIYGDPDDPNIVYSYLFYNDKSTGDSDKYCWYDEEDEKHIVSASNEASYMPYGCNTLMFDTDWIERPDDFRDFAMYYFEIPVNAGEYALGSVDEEGRYGAYLCYLDIGASAAEHSSVLGTIDFVYDNNRENNGKIVVVPDTSESATTPDYYTPSMAIIYTKNADKESESSEDYTVLIDNFTIKVRRYLASTNEGSPGTIKTAFGGSDAEHITISIQGGGDNTPDG
ncbi:MAG: hypothetical protein IJU20_07385 [Clostridia bacterium]|nr:hypothetical protein [Clostridia bacterium]